MVARLGWADAVAGAPSYVGRALRQLMSPLVSGATAARPLGASSGVRPGTPASIVTATSTVWTVTPFAGVIDLEASAIAGPYPFSFDANVTNAVTAANASYPRVDILYVRVSDPAEGDGTAAPVIEVLYLAGTAAAVPVAPAAPARSFVIANLNVPITGGGSPAVTWNAPYTVAAGGILPVSGTAVYPASPYVGQQVDDATLGYPVRWNGAAWLPPADTGWIAYTPSLTNLTLGNGTLIARYRLRGKSVEMYVFITLGSTSAVSANPTIGLPVMSKYFLIAQSTAYYRAATGWYGGVINLSQYAAVLQALQSGSYITSPAVSSTVPWTWTINDQISIGCTYEAA